MRRREPLTPDMTPLVDVVFILLIFFIVTSVFKREELLLPLTLPSATTQPLEVESKPLTIELSSDRIAFQGEVLSLEQLQDKLHTISNKERPLLLRIDEAVTYKRVVALLDLLQQASLTHLSLVTTTPSH